MPVQNPELLHTSQEKVKSVGGKHVFEAVTGNSKHPVGILSLLSLHEDLLIMCINQTQKKNGAQAQIHTLREKKGARRLQKYNTIVASPRTLRLLTSQ